MANAAEPPHLKRLCRGAFASARYTTLRRNADQSLSMATRATVSNPSGCTSSRMMSRLMSVFCADVPLQYPTQSAPEGANFAFSPQQLLEKHGPVFREEQNGRKGPRARAEELRAVGQYAQHTRQMRRRELEQNLCTGRNAELFRNRRFDHGGIGYHGRREWGERLALLRKWRRRRGPRHVSALQ